MKKIIRLTEQDLHRIVENSVRRILKEDISSDLNSFNDEDDFADDEDSFDDNDYIDNEDLSLNNFDNNNFFIKGILKAPQNKVIHAFHSFTYDNELLKYQKYYFEFLKDMNNIGYNKAINLFVRKNSSNAVLYQLYREIYG